MFYFGFGFICQTGSSHQSGPSIWLSRERCLLPSMTHWVCSPTHTGWRRRNKAHTLSSSLLTAPLASPLTTVMMAMGLEEDTLGSHKPPGGRDAVLRLRLQEQSEGRGPFPDHSSNQLEVRRRQSTKRHQSSQRELSSESAWRLDKSGCEKNLGEAEREF